MSRCYSCSQENCGYKHDCSCDCHEEEKKVNPYREPGKVRSIAEQMAAKAKIGKIEETLKRANRIKEFKATALKEVIADD